MKVLANEDCNFRGPKKLNSSLISISRRTKYKLNTRNRTDYCRLYCLIPWTEESEEERVNKFFHEFAKYGQLEYIETVKNNTFGYVKYIDKEDAKKAMRKSKGTGYAPIFADERKRSAAERSLDPYDLKIFHETCGNEIYASTQALHYETCAKQLNYYRSLYHGPDGKPVSQYPSGTSQRLLCTCPICPLSNS
ncbi:hypothetical protein TKK_0016878 [Trichogramma kaykai]|uniref:RRM domain-containing protein n=1 Tax=Trichogramma kaykai TaxID=54128 RepID=A0ABD2W4P6_9HYME